MPKNITIDNVDALASAINTGTVEDGSITTAKLAAAAVTSAKMAIFVSTEQTGTGAAQTIAHGLGVTPSKVLIVPTYVPADGITITEGTHGTANVAVTVTTGAKFKVLAIA